MLGFRNVEAGTNTLGSGSSVEGNARNQQWKSGLWNDTSSLHHRDAVVLILLS